MRLFSLTVTLGVCAVASTGALAAQCPDGTPPPCGAARRAAPAPNSVAVLVFESASGDTSLAWLGEGLAEEVATQLGAGPGLVVRGAGIVRSASRVASGDPRRIGQLVSAHYVVEGSYRPAGQRVRVSARLLVLPAGDQRWGRVYDRSRDSLATLSDDIARDLAAALGSSRRRAERRPPDAQAYEAFQRGRSFFLRNDIETARALFEEAIRHDSTFAPAWAGLAMVWSEVADLTVAPLVAYPRARTAAQRALALDSTIANANLPLALAGAALERDCQGGERLVNRAIALDSTLPEAWIERSLMLSCEGREAEALAAIRHSWELDSLSGYTGIYLIYMTVLLRPQQVPEVLTLVRSRLAPEDAQFWDGYAAVQRGDCAAGERLMRPYAGTFLIGWYVPSLVCLGRRAEADSVIRAAIADTARQFTNPVAVASALVGLGDRDGALRWLELGADERTWWAMLIHVMADLAPLRSEPRFQALERRLGLLP